MDLSDRMRNYEDVTRTKLVRRTPVLVRVDGKAFHTLTRKLDKPFSKFFECVMDKAVVDVCKRMQNCVLAYIQSDEVSFLLVDWKTLETEPWFGNDVRKITSVSASMMTAYFNWYWFTYSWTDKIDEHTYPFAQFDSRVWNLPKEEVCNYFVERQKDATRNSIQGVARAHFSQKECHKLSSSQLQEKLFQEKDINWNNYHIRYKRGRCAVKVEKHDVTPEEASIRRVWEIDEEIPIFSKNRNYIEDHLTFQENMDG